MSAFKIWLAVTILLGCAFIGGQIWEYTGLIQNGTTINRNLFASTFFTVTGFHGLHVTGGIVALSIMWLMARFGYLTAKRSHVLGAIGIYWHFVDVVWIAVFSIIYLGYLQ